MRQPTLDLNPLTCQCPCGCQTIVDKPGACWPCWSGARDDGIQGHIARRRELAAKTEEVHMGEAHIHVRRFVGLHEVNGERVMETVEATTDRARVDRLVEQYRQIGGEEHAAQLEVQADCTCKILELEPCPACAFAHVGIRPDCEVCQGAGEVTGLRAWGWEQMVESAMGGLARSVVKSTRRGGV